MNSLAPSKTLNCDKSRAGAQRCAVVALGALLFALSSHNLLAQVGDNNPGGHSGIFNGQINTGCSYDPYTGNATRSITDIAVAGAVGEYPLALVRTANSRAPSTTEVFGWAGGWNHNYNWILEDSPTSTAQNAHPKRYTVEFPDGRVETFHAVTWDSVYRVRPGADTPAQTTSAGVRERFLQLNLSNMYAYLILPDGGAVEFKAEQHNGNGNYYYKYHVTGIYDPHGLKTAITSEVTPNGAWRRITRVTEPAGRYLQFTYTGPNSHRISQVQEFIGGVGRRTVNYYYIYCNSCWLDHVLYYNNANWTAHYQYCNANVGQGMPPLLWTADDPMYAGPMKRIGYVYRAANNPDGTTRVYGQIQSENYYDGTTVGAAVSTLTVGEANPINHNKRKETLGDGATRTFLYTPQGRVTWVSDFMGHSAQQHYDVNTKYVDYVVDRRGHRTDYTSDPITGNVTQVQFPLTPGDTPNQTQRPTINYTYTNSYYLHTIRDEGNHTTTFTRDGSNRITQIDYPDGGYETFGYDASHFYQLSSHRMKTGGIETFSYDASHKLQYYSDPYHSNPDNPSIHYYYDGLDRVSGVTDALSHSTNFDYNDRGQRTVTTLPWINQQRYTITNAYNPDGTLQSRTDELGHSTDYTYDDYRRLKTVTPPARGDNSGTHTTSFYYGANPWDGVSDYKLTDSNATYVVLPSGKKIKTVYDDNRRKSSVAVAQGTVDEATTSYTYDAGGNVAWVTDPRSRWINISYDERDRPSSINDFGRITTFTYDTAGRKKEIDRPDGQVITNVSFDEMNRVLQQNVTQTPDPIAITKYTYYPGSGLLHTLQDPHLVALNNGEQYEYIYDAMGRKAIVGYPHDSQGTQTFEAFTYDDAGRLYTAMNRSGKTQTFTYDALNRMTGFGWDDIPRTPSVSFSYDAASRLTEIDNANANISRSYYNDNLLHMETQSLSAIGGVDNRHVTYTYDEDANRASLAIPGYTFDYTYTNRSQVKWINDDATGAHQAYYEYDLGGNVTLRNAYTSPVIASNYNYDGYDRVTSITHALNNATRTFTYGYDNNSDNRLWAKRGITPTSPENNKGEAFSYDLADQAIAFQLNVANPQNVSQPLPQNITYDQNGNRTNFQAIQYSAANNLSQYTTRTGGTTAAYDFKGSMTTGLDGSTYTYDAQNRLLSATKNGVTMSFKYDGLNRQVSRTVSGTTTYSTWDGWNLVEDYTNNPGLVIQARYLYGPTGLVKELQNNRYYCQDGSGSTALLADSTAHLLEWYRYDLQGSPFFYNPNDTQRNPNQSGYSVHHLFTGQQWYSDIGLYDLRNRFYSPDIGRFLQTDPIGFGGDATNLYRYSGNNPIIGSDPTGLDAVPHSGGYYTYVAYWPWNRMVGMHIVNGSEWLQCAGAARYLGGGYLNGVYYNMPNTRYWYQGAMLSTATAPGTIVVEGWGPDGRYPNLRIDQYSAGQTINHTLVLEYWDKDGNAHLYSQNPNGSIHETIVNEDDAWQYYEVYVKKSNGPYESTPSTRSVAEGNGASTNPGSIWRSPSIISGIFYPFGFGNRSPNLNFAEGIARTINGAFSWTLNDSTNSPTLSNFGYIYEGNPVGAMEPGECFVAGTPVVMGNGRAKAIEDITVGEEVLAWNEETKITFSTKVVEVLHHDEKTQTLFDIELEDGRTFTSNNNHPIYVVEDGGFRFTDELAARFAKGEPITFQDNNDRPIKVAIVRMRREMCKTYNLHVEGQGNNGHTYYANGILVHNFGAGSRRK
jgi:RHS repeat-associated protein